MAKLGQVLAASSRAPRQALGDWFGKTIRLTDGDFWAAFMGRESSSGKIVTVDSAMQLSAVWACVRLIAETVATLPLGLYRRAADGGREAATDHALYDLLHHQPNADMTAVQFWEAVVASLLLRGNAFVLKHIGALGRIVALELLLPHRVSVRRLNNGELEYTYQPTRGGAVKIPQASMMHIAGFSFDGVIGLSAIQYGANVFGAAASAEGASSGTFKNGLLQTVAFSVDRDLKKEQREEFREYVKTISGAMNAGKSPVLERGVKAENIGIDPIDAQLLESRAFGVEEICRWFRVPPFMVGHSEKSTSWGTGIEQQMLGFLAFSLRPWLTRIEQSVRKSLLRPGERAGLYAEFAIEGLLRADSAARSAFYSQMTQNGIYSRDDCRVRENLPRLGGNAAVLTVQSNLLPIDKLGGGQDSAAARNALLTWLNTSPSD